MSYKIYIFFCQCILFWNFTLYDFAIAKAFVGHNVRPAMRHEFRFVVGITERNHPIDPERDIICTGSFITKEDVLTAAHCIEDRSLNGVQINVGSTDLISTSRYYPSWWITYDQWSCDQNINTDFLTNDIAIIRCQNTISANIPIIMISFLSTEDLLGQNVDSVGWGEVNNGSYPRILQTVNLNILSKQECEQRLTNLQQQCLRIQENLICTIGNPFSSLMYGDSGGALLHANTIIGVNTGTCPLPQQIFHPDKINIHTNTFYYRQFIFDTLNCK